MGAAVSDWRLARAVASRGQLGVVSGTGIDSVFVRRLQDGDTGGHLRRAMAAFPLPDTAAAVEARWYRTGGRPPGTPYGLLPLYRRVIPTARQRLLMLASFCEVWLAKDGHGGLVGINLLTKIQPPTLPALYGAMLAGVDVVLMGAGIPREIPGALDHLALHEAARIRLDVEGASADEDTWLTFEPASHWPGPPPTLTRPQFLPIIASTLLATVLTRKTNGRVDGFVIEAPTAGGHNAPPRGTPVFTEHGEPVYGEKDQVDLGKVAAIGLPFWLAGGAGHPGRLREARAQGAAGIQVGTLFAFCEESGLARNLKHSIIEHAMAGRAKVRTDARASPTGYPFKVVDWPDNPAHGVTRERLCDLGYLRTAYKRPDGTMGYRCPGEPEDAYVKKGGALEDTVGRKCLCNSLLAVIDHPQIRAGGLLEQPLVTAGDDLANIGSFLRGRTRYSAADVLDYLLS